MPLRTPVASFLLAVFACTMPLYAQPAGRHENFDDPELGHRHQQAHARHPHLTHPLVTESPLPETQFRLSAAYAAGGDAGSDVRAATVEASFEYAVAPQFGFELAVPYSYLDVEDSGSQERLDNVEVGFKFADYRFGEHGLLLGAGLELALPTGDAGAGIGSDRLVELEPYVAFGLRRSRFESIGVLRLGVPLNEPAGEAEEVDLELGADLSLLYHLTPHVAALLELNGGAVLAGESDESLLTVSPGVSVAPFETQRFRFAVGAGFPVAGDSDTDYELRVMTIWHF